MDFSHRFGDIWEFTRTKLDNLYKEAKVKKNWYEPFIIFLSFYGIIVIHLAAREQIDDQNLIAIVQILFIHKSS